MLGDDKERIIATFPSCFYSLSLVQPSYRIRLAQIPIYIPSLRLNVLYQANAESDAHLNPLS